MSVADDRAALGLPTCWCVHCQPATTEVVRLCHKGHQLRRSPKGKSYCPSCRTERARLKTLRTSPKCLKCHKPGLRAGSKALGIHMSCLTKTERHRYWKYGLTPDDLATLTARAGGVCQICRQAEATDVDHCHDTNRVRGLLCLQCNMAIGLLRHDVVALANAILYLEGSK